MSQHKYYYKVIKPYESNNVYLASSLMSGAGKCYSEVIRVNPASRDFSIIDINSNGVFDFNINPPPISQELISPNINVTLEDIKEIRDKITNIDSRLNKLEGNTSKISSEDKIILLGGDNKINNYNKIQESNVNTLSQVNTMNINNNRNLVNKLNNGQDVNINLARKLIN